MYPEFLLRFLCLTARCPCSTMDSSITDCCCCCCCTGQHHGQLPNSQRGALGPSGASLVQSGICRFYRVFLLLSRLYKEYPQLSLTLMPPVHDTETVASFLPTFPLSRNSRKIDESRTGLM